MPSSRCITVAAGIGAIACAAVPLTTPNSPSISQQIHNLSSLHIAHNDLTLAENVQQEINYINNTSLFPDFRGKAELDFLYGSADEGVYPLRATDCRGLALGMKIPHPDPPFSFVGANNDKTEDDWTQWTAPYKGNDMGPSKWLGVKTYVYRWEELQALMSLEEADHRLKAAGYNGRIVYFTALKRGKTEATAKLEYWFGMFDFPTRGRRRVLVLANARNGGVTRER